MGNYSQYLERMTNSALKTTKQLIPVYALATMASIEKPRILEVGIGSAVIGEMLHEALPNAYLVGIDTNSFNVEAALEKHCYNECLVQDFMTYHDKPFDLIVFSSVIHEICAYTRESYKYSGEKTLDATFEKTYELLNKNGYIIIRDGLAEDIELRNQDYSYATESYNTVKKFLQFVNEFKAYNIEEFDYRSMNIQIYPRKESSYFEITCPRWFMREFLCTATWGDESWEREIQERFCFTNDESMRWALTQHNLTVQTALFTSERYNEYFKKLICFPDEQNIIGLYVAKRED